MKFQVSSVYSVVGCWLSRAKTSRFLISLIGGFCLSLLLFGPGWGSAPAIAQRDPNTGFTGVQIPYTSITPANGRVNIDFVNETGSAIDYQVIGDTQFRSLAGRSQMSLEGLAVPTTFTFRRADNGFLQVTLHPNSPKSGTLTMRVRETANFSEDRTTVFIDESGRVYLN